MKKTASDWEEVMRELRGDWGFREGKGRVPATRWEETDWMESVLTDLEGLGKRGNRNQGIRRIRVTLAGGHINPAVSLMFVSFRQLAPVKFVLYLLAQVREDLRWIAESRERIETINYEAELMKCFSRRSVPSSELPSPTPSITVSDERESV